MSDVCCSSCDLLSKVQLKVTQYSSDVTQLQTYFTCHDVYDVCAASKKQTRSCVVSWERDYE